MIMNIGDNKITVKQTGSGFWYCSELSITGNSIMDVIALADAAMYKAEMLLDKYNTHKDDIKKK